MWHVSFFAATELLADADVSEGATKKKQTRGNDKMNAVIVIRNSLFLIAMSWLIFTYTDVQYIVLTVSDNWLLWKSSNRAVQVCLIFS